MDKENKDNHPSNGKKDNDSFPPKIEGLRYFFLYWFADPIMAISAIFIIWLCLNSFIIHQNWPFCPTCWPYIPFFLFLFGLILDRYLRHKINVHKARLVDHSQATATIVEARTVEPRLNAPEERPEEYETKKNHLLTEVKRLEDLGSKFWTEYQVLSLDQMLVDFLKVDDLKANSQSSLADLEEYAGDDAYRYDIELFNKWKDRIDKATSKIDKKEEDENSNKLEIDSTASSLRAELKTLLEHVAIYTLKWAEGSVIINDLKICCAFAGPILIATGVLPVFLFPQQNVGLGVLNWGFLGSSGSLLSVLLALYYKSNNLVEVGNTEGRSELWRALTGVILGFFAGIISFSIIKGGLLEGVAVPDLKEPLKEVKDIYLSIVWAVGAGMGFESIFDRMRKSMERTT